MEEDILNYLPTVMFRGTPCNYGISIIYEFYIVFKVSSFMGNPCILKLINYYIVFTCQISQVWSSQFFNVVSKLVHPV